MPTEKPLLMTVEHFLRQTNMPPSLFGRRALRDPSFVSDLRRGRSVGNSVRCRVEHFMNITRATAQQGDA